MATGDQEREPPNSSVISVSIVMGTKANLEIYNHNPNLF